VARRLAPTEPQPTPPDKTDVNIEVVHRICNEFRNLPILDDRSADEIIAYDQFGGLGS